MVVHALSHRYVFLSTLEAKFLGFQCIKMLHEHDVDFCYIYHTCSHTTFEWYFKHDGYLVKDIRLCIPKCLIRKILVKETHERGLIGHVGVSKTYEILHEHF